MGGAAVVFSAATEFAASWKGLAIVDYGWVHLISLCPQARNDLFRL